MLEKLRENIVFRIASRHIAGRDLRDAVSVCDWVTDRGHNYILSSWRNGDEKHPSETNKKENIYSFMNSIVAIKQIGGNGYLSLKLDAIGYDNEAFLDILSLARSANVRIHIDSLGQDTCDANFSMIERASEYHDILGCTLPSRWARSREDAKRAADLKLAVRIVKGQWEDASLSIDPRENYMAIAKIIAGKVPYIGIATHDKKLTENALTYLENSDSKVEVEQFFSLPLNAMDLAIKYSMPYRVYVSYGYPSIPYNYKFAMTRPVLGFWMLSDFTFHFRKPWTGSDEILQR
ncbi:hypothetical protein AB2B38_002600 [Balneola sp. MJW-20]|uniref:hypothetical protein n=1 Tax=Gracilimonas aurantiaca TaxID=3234185 RepID=UPI0034654B5A